MMRKSVGRGAINDILSADYQDNGSSIGLLKFKCCTSTLSLSLTLESVFSLLPAIW